MTNLNIRPFEPTDAEYEAVVDLVNRVWPDDPSSVEHWRDSDSKRNPNYLFQRFVCEVPSENGASKIAAVGACWESAWAYKPGKYGLDFDVAPDCEGQGLDEPMYSYITQFLATREPAPVELKTHVREDKVDRVTFFAQQNFQQTMREPDSQLNVGAFDFAPFDGVIDQVTGSGFKIETIADLQKWDENWMQKVYDLENAIDEDVPDTDDPTPQPLEEYAKRFDRSNIRPDAWFIALDGDQYVGMSTLWPSTVLKDKLYVGVTGVLRSHRRRRIALALKLKTVEFAKAYGAKIIETGNEENNPMYELNMKLGFKPIPAWLTLEKKY
ncbi:GNAT family N-acetyltransferase [Chloroflexi bacterium TSY]|nr:GNAT family N-acetyltransferase [Chloroflexi bacterium TSY]